MNNTFLSKQTSKTGNLDANLILRQYKPDLTSRFVAIKSFKPKLAQKEIAKELGYSDSTVGQNRNEIKKRSPFRFSEMQKDLKRTQKTSEKTVTEIVKPITNGTLSPFALRIRRVYWKVGPCKMLIELMMNL